MARPVVGNPFDSQIPTVSPTATPVDTFVRGVEKRSPLASLASTLDRFSRKAVPALQRMEQEAAERELLEGQRLYQENRVAIGEAVKEGIIEEGASPYLRKGYRISQMNTLATRYAEELEANLVTQKLYTNGDPQRIEAYVQKFQQDFIERNGMSEFSDAEVAEYFGLSAGKADEAFRSAWRSKHVAWQKEQQYKQFEAEVAEVVRTLIQPDMSDEQQDIAYAKAAVWLQDQAKLRNLDGQDNKRVSDSIVNGILFAAVQNQDPELLDVMLRTQVGTDVIGKSVSRMKQVFDTKVTIAKLQEAEATRAANEVKAAHTALAGEVSANVFANIHSSNYDPVFVNTQIARLTATKDEKLVNEAITLMNYQNTINDLVQGSLFTPDLYAEGDAIMAAQPTRASAISAATAFVKANGLGTDDLDKLMSEWEQNYSPTGDEFGLKFNVSSTLEGSTLAEIKETVLGSEYAADYENPQKRKAFSIIKFDYKRRVREYVRSYQTENNVDEVPEEALEYFIYTLQNELLTQFLVEADGSSGYNTANEALQNLAGTFTDVTIPDGIGTGN